MVTISAKDPASADSHTLMEELSGTLARISGDSGRASFDVDGDVGYKALGLETRLVNERAVTFYERRGYRRISNLGKYVGSTKAVCFEKQLFQTTPE
jgi:ribosomal protein S18 acetylase RimI-like enzyme